MRLPFVPGALHTSERPSATAQWTALGRTLELQRPFEQRIVSDEYAPVFLTRKTRAVAAPLRAAGPLVRLAERGRELAPISAFALCRHRFIDEHLLDALDGTDQVVVLGAGYDSRAYRFSAQLAGRAVYEVDLPPLSRRKAGIVASHPDVFGRTAVNRVEIDFRRQELGDVLTEAGFTRGARTYIAWEGVSPYLSRAAVSGTLETLRDLCGPDSIVAMDFWDGIGGTGLLAPVRRLGAAAIGLVGEPVTFGMRPDTAVEFLDMHGATVVDLVQHSELAERYATDGRKCEKSVYVLAARF